MKMTENNWFLPPLLVFIANFAIAFWVRAYFPDLTNLAVVIGSLLVMVTVVICGSRVEKQRV